MARSISLARVFIPSPEYDALAGGVYGVCARALDGVLCELVESMPNRDDLPVYREFYEIIDGVYNMTCVSGALPGVKPFVKWYQTNKAPVSSPEAKIVSQVTRRNHEPNVLVCNTMGEYHLLEHIHSNFVNKLNNRPMTNYTKKLPACFDTDLKNERVRALVQKWAFPQRYK
jgi:hypothetical protein